MGGGAAREDRLRAEVDSLFGAKGDRKIHWSGPIVLQPAAALEAFVRMAAANAEFVYCEAPEPMYGETWSRAGELARDGLIRTLSRRRAGGGWQYYAVRTGKCLPKQLTPQQKVLADRATALIFAQLKRDANLERPCSSDTDLARAAGLTLRQQAGNRVRKLVEAGLILSEQVYQGGVPSRVVTILPSKYAGASAGKFTALPKSWRAPREAAGREAHSSGDPATPTGLARAADQADLDRLRKAGL